MAGRNWLERRELAYMIHLQRKAEIQVLFEGSFPAIGTEIQTTGGDLLVPNPLIALLEGDISSSMLRLKGSERLWSPSDR